MSFFNLLVQNLVRVGAKSFMNCLCTDAIHSENRPLLKAMNKPKKETSEFRINAFD